jgi:type VI protein secretion system component VasK
VRWPGGDSQIQGADLAIQISDDFVREISKPGPWGLFSLIGTAQRTRINDHTFTAVWELNVQNMYRVHQRMRIELQQNSHPFEQNPFLSFDIPQTPLRVSNGGAKATPRQSE